MVEPQCQTAGCTWSSSIDNCNHALIRIESVWPTELGNAWSQVGLIRRIDRTRAELRALQPCLCGFIYICRSTCSASAVLLPPWTWKDPIDSPPLESMPILRLRKHPVTFSDEDILIHQSDYIALKLKDVVELKPVNGSANSDRVLLQVRKWAESNYYPNSVSIKDSVVSAALKLYGDVQVNIVNKKDVVVDSIEICFSNAYLARSYMWGLRNYLNDRCVYQRQKLDYLNIHSQICEIWSQGEKVTSGYVDDDTKIVFRSASSLVYLFIQMSSEMWDYDINGDLYCEKAINGFLTELFETWRRNECSHDITIILFSRTFYDAESLEEFPKEMRECLQLDYKNRFYEDCYRVAFQNDRFDLHDWNAKLTTLKSLFNQYQKEVIDRHQDKYSTKIPRAYNSNAAQGNFLEVLNMSLNVFEKHYFDRSFDRTGQLSVVVSPGVGVFEVDFEMTNLTKQRIIDNGIGSDLVCLGEQPLHTVPLLKFNSKSSPKSDNLATCDVYNMPHWINLSFYSSQNQVYYSNFVPRIKLPTIHNKLTSEASKATLVDVTSQSNNLSTPNNSNQFNSAANQKDINLNCSPLNEKQNVSSANNLKEPRATRSGAAHQMMNHPTIIPDLVDYDDYDTQVFRPNSMITYHNQQPSQRCDRTVLSDLDPNMDCLADDGDDDDDEEDDFLARDKRNKSASVQRRSSDVKNYQEYSRSMKRQQASDNLPIGQIRGVNQTQSTFTRMSLVDSYLTDVKIRPESADDLSVRGYNVQSSRINRSSGRPKALINPFDPSHMTIKLTPNRRRWTHVFPQGPTGTFMQQHHYQPVPQKSSAPYLVDVSPTTDDSTPGQSSLNRAHLPKIDPRVRDQGMNMRSTSGVQVNPVSPLGNQVSSNKSIVVPVIHNSNSKSTLVSNDTIRFAWCASGEQEWTPAITTGVDWKSLTMPACLPLTTDFFPSQTSLQNDYVIGEYTIDASCIHSRYTLLEVYRELVCQRLQKGFQIILLPNQSNGGINKAATSSNNLEQRLSVTTHKSSRPSKSRSSSHADSSGADVTAFERTEYTMSIGRIFHKLSLSGNTITVTQYRPRHPYPTIKIDYCYRFRAPFHDTYGQSWVHFKSEKLENYSWNYLDNYICARGQSFELRSSLKFWRFRILIIPSLIGLRKQSVESSGHTKKIRNDIYYLDFDHEERNHLMESFVKLLEIINKTRRASACRVSASKQQAQCSPTRLNVRINSKESTEVGTASGGRNSPVSAKIDDTTKSAIPASSDGHELKFESINMDIDSALRDARRSEWVHVQYHSYYDVNQAFELVIKWMVASGAGIAEMVQGWSRKAGSNSSVHVVPIPWEPFALPHSGKADPLRCPIGIELHLDCLYVSMKQSAKNGKSATLSDNQVLRLQEQILRHFGFLTFHDLISTENIERQFVHMSGFAFVALPNLVSETTDEPAGKTSLADDLGSSKYTSSSALGLPIKSKVTMASLKIEEQETVSSPHEEYITRHISGARKNKASRLRGETNERFEFIWSWNYMLTKRWRSPSTQDESQAVSLMLDFRDFCANGSERLVNFWEQVKHSL